MKTTTLTIKLFLIISLFASVALAEEGQMGGGNLFDNGQMGGGNMTCSEETMDENGNCVDDDEDALSDSVLIFIKDYLAKLLDN